MADNTHSFGYMRVGDDIRKFSKVLVCTEQRGCQELFTSHSTWESIFNNKEKVRIMFGLVDDRPVVRVIRGQNSGFWGVDESSHRRGVYSSGKRLHRWCFHMGSRNGRRGGGY